MAKFHLIYGIRNYWGTKCWNLTSRFSCQMTKSSQGKGKKTANWVIIYQSHPFQKSLSLKKTAWPLGPGIFGKFHPHPNLWYGFMNPHSLRYHRASQKKKHARWPRSCLTIFGFPVKGLISTFFPRGLPWFNGTAKKRVALRLHI